MSCFDDLVDRVTDRLRVDPELRLEVKRELRDHLADSAKAFRDGGDSDEQAEANAIKALGDESEVSEGLWRANRGRIRLRRWMWWAARLTLLPATCIAVVYFIISGIATSSYYATIDSGGFAHSSWAAQWAESRLLSGMDDQQKLIYFGDRTAGNRIDRWRPLRDAYPDEPLYQLHLINVVLSELEWGYDKARPSDPEVLAALLAEIDRGEGLDPHNGIYAQLRAALMLAQAGLLEEDESRVFMALNRDGQREAKHLIVWASPPDDALLSEGIAAFLDAVDASYATMHTVDMVRHRLDQLPPPRSMREIVHRMADEISTLLPALSWQRRVARAVCAEALRRAEVGDREGALQLLDTLRDLNRANATASNTLIGLLVDVSVRTLELQTRVFVFETLGDDAAAESARADADAWSQRFYDLWNNRDAQRQEEMERRAGALMSILIPAIPGYDVDFSAFRQAEYTLIDRGVLTGLLILLVGVSVLASVVGLWRRFRSRNGEPVVLIWIGWRRLAWVMGLAVLLPVLLFAALVSTPLGGREYGINHNLNSMFWYFPLVAGVLMLVWVLGIAAIRSRAETIGIHTPSPLRWWLIVLPVLLVMGLTIAIPFLVSATTSHTRKAGEAIGDALLWALVVLTVVVWLWLVWQLVWMRSARSFVRVFAQVALHVSGALIVLGVPAASIVYLASPELDRGAFTVLTIVAVFVIALIVGLIFTGRQPGRTPRFAGSAIRSVAPLFAVAGLLLVATVGPLLHFREAALAGQMMETSPVWFEMEIERSDAKLLKAYLADGAPKPPRLPRSANR